MRSMTGQGRKGTRGKAGVRRAGEKPGAGSGSPDWKRRPGLLLWTSRPSSAIVKQPRPTHCTPKITHQAELLVTLPSEGPDRNQTPRPWRWLSLPLTPDS